MENIELKNLKIKIAQKLIRLNTIPVEQVGSIVELDETAIQAILHEVYGKEENEFQEKLQALCTGLNVPKLKTIIASAEVEHQNTPAHSVGFFDAFQAAIYNILTDVNSPRTLIDHILEQPERLGLGEYPSKLSIYTAIQDLLQHQNSHLELVSVQSKKQPTRGESSKDCWIFALHLPSFLPNTHWAVVPKDGGKSYNYN